MRKLVRPLLRKLNILEYAQQFFLFYLNGKRKIVVTILLPVFSSNGFLSSIYYTFFNKTFYREHQANLKGRMAHEKIYSGKVESDYILAHNIHALEKGLSMRPLKKVFAINYIQETVQLLNRAINQSEYYTHDQIQWYFDVLHEYFSKVGSHIIINSAREVFKKIELTYKSKTDLTHKPYLRKDASKLDISFEQIMLLGKKRRSVRWFEQKPVPRELIDKAIEFSKLSPSACNRQPFEFRIFDEKSSLEKVIDLPSGTSGFGHNIPALAVIVGKLDAYIHERDRHVIYIDGSLAAMSFMYALETLGLSSCPLNWPDINHLEKKMSKVLNLSKYERPVIIIGFGYPDEEGLIAYSEKKSLDQIRTYNSFGKP